MQIAYGRKSQFRLLPLVLSAAIAVPAAACLGAPAFALSELQQAQQPAAPSGEAPQQQAPSTGASDSGSSSGGLPAPAPLIDSTKSGQPAVISQDTKPAEIFTDISKAPEAVQKMRQRIMEAAAAGDLKKVIELMNPGPDQTDIGPDDSGNNLEGALKDMSGDGDGLEILSIMLDILSTGFAHVDAGTPDEAYVWPYLAEKRLDQLTPAEKVDLMRIVTAGDYADMLEYGGYNFYRVGISPDGKWKFFLSGN